MTDLKTIKNKKSNSSLFFCFTERKILIRTKIISTGEGQKDHQWRLWTVCTWGQNWNDKVSRKWYRESIDAMQKATNGYPFDQFIFSKHVVDLLTTATTVPNSNKNVHIAREMIEMWPFQYQQQNNEWHIRFSKIHYIVSSGPYQKKRAFVLGGKNIFMSCAVCADWVCCHFCQLLIACIG